MTQPQPMSHGGEFTGRPATALYSDHRAVVKIRSDILLKEAEAQRWCQTRIEKERNLNVHHPDKTWFAWRQHERWVVGNVAPMLRALHRIPADEWQHIYRSVMQQYTQLYFAAVNTNSCRLDDGLSNFGLDDAGKLYYLDDDIYSWDDGMAMAYAMSNLARSQDWLNEESAYSLGELMGERCLEVCGSQQYLASLIRQTVVLFLPRERDQRALIKLGEGLSMALRAHNKRGPNQRNKARFSKRYMAVIGDVHGNEPALRAVLAYLDQEGIKDILVTGDVVGYGPDPEICVSLLRERDALVIAGNHDFVCGGGEFPRGFSPDARWVIEWSRERLKQDDLDWLGNLPRVYRQDDWMAVHGAPIDKHYFYAYVYAMTYEDNLQHLADIRTRLCFHGHTHMPGVYYQGELNHGFSDAAEQSLAPYHHALICPGSVGQPRSGYKGTEFAVYDREENRLRLIRLQYDVDPVLEKMRKENFPIRLLTRLMQGR